MKSELDQLYERVDEIKVAMSPAIPRAAGADLWFVASEGTGKLHDIEHDPHVNRAYFNGPFFRGVSHEPGSKPIESTIRQRG